MKEIFSSLLLGSLLFSGCSTKTTNINTNSDYINEFKDAPNWVMDNPKSNYTAVASAKITHAGLEYAELEATTLAKTKIVKQINADIKSETKTFIQTSGVGAETTIDKAISDIARHNSNNNLTSIRIKNKWISDTNTLWILVESSAPSSSFQNKEAQHQLDLAKEADAKLK